MTIDAAEIARLRSDRNAARAELEKARAERDAARALLQEAGEWNNAALGMLEGDAGPPNWDGMRDLRTRIAQLLGDA